MITIIIIDAILILLGLVVCGWCGKRIAAKQAQLKELKNSIIYKEQVIEEQSSQEKDLQSKISHLQATKDALAKQSQELSLGIQDAINSRKKIVETAFLEYCALLEAQYKAEEQNYDQYEQTLKDSYEKLRDDLMSLAAQCQADIEAEKVELEKVRQTRIAATAAMVREQEIKEQKEFYSLTVSASDLFDIQALETIKQKLSKPRILSMLIWQTYYQKQMTSLCNNVLGVNPVCGIYKITNQLNNRCYIGQAVNVAERWKEHAKCGLGIDTPVGNKLYQAMQQDGIQNFTWELIEKCPAASLNEKEKYYIEFYQSKDYGYNILAGNSKKG